MFPDPTMDAALFEIAERRREADAHRLAHSFQRSRAAGAGRLRLALGSLLLRLGGAVLGEEAWLRSDIAGCD